MGTAVCCPPSFTAKGMRAPAEYSIPTTDGDIMRSTTPLGWIEMKNAHQTNQRRNRPSAMHIESGISRLERSFIRTPDFRDMRACPEVRFVNHALVPKRKVHAPPRRLEYPGRPLDSQGGTFSIPRGTKVRAQSAASTRSEVAQLRLKQRVFDTTSGL